jgi:large subunit ribosomal protein L9
MIKYVYSILIEIITKIAMPTQVILKQDVESLGQAGELVKVKPGYARNFLLPQGVAVLATYQNLQWLQEHKLKLEEEAKQKREECLKLKDILENLGDLQLTAQVGPTGKLFGRITGKDLADKYNEVSSGQLSVSHKQITIVGYLHGIDELGTYNTEISFGSGIKAQSKVVVTES